LGRVNLHIQNKVQMGKAKWTQREGGRGTWPRTRTNSLF